MKYLEVLVLVILCQSTLSLARWPVLQSLDSDLDTLLCSSNTYTTTIIDIHASMENGAELMDGRWSQDLADCTSGCCDTEGCDLALFKNEGTSNSGKNCYYVRCGDLKNCKMVEHSAFTSVFFGQGTERTGDRTGHPASVPTTTAHTPPSTSPPPSPTTPPPSEAPPTTSHAPSSTVQPTQHTTPPTSSVPNQEESKNNTTVPNSNEAGDEDKAGDSDRKKGSSGGNNKVPDRNKSPSSSSGTKPSAKAAAEDRGDDCGQYGCDGSGVVAVVVVGVICFVIVLVVVAILLKKVVDEKRKRKFKNVDYLINGMYT